ncbi:MAG TPA: DUF3616 domain-containing protein [Solirubrobacterales bacterium]|nr:DUF3616 domain-containing protein [Solirubrobacterales bacterium]
MFVALAASLALAVVAISSAGAAEGTGREGDHLVVSQIPVAATAQGVTLVRFNGLGTSDGSSWALPTTTSGSNNRFTLGGESNAVGALARSVNGKYVTLAGTTAAVGGNPEGTDPRVVARVNGAGTVDTSTTLGKTFGASKIRGAVTNDGNQFWVTGNGNTEGSTPLGGMVYQPFGGTGTPTVIVSKEALSSSNKAFNNFRSVQIAGGNLYTGSEKGTAGVYQVAGLPTKATSPTTVTTFSGEIDPISELPLEHEPGTGKVDLMYVAKESDGIYKYSLSGSTWTERGKLVSGSFSGITGKVDSEGHFRLYAISGYGAGNSVVTLTDTAAFNAAPATTGSSSVSTAAAGNAYRGIAFAPTVEATLPGAPTGVGATAGDSKATLSWTAPANTGGSSITAYKITPFRNGAGQPSITTPSAATGYTVEGLTNGSSYTFTVAAINASGTGPASEPSAAVIPSAPGAPLPVISLSDEYLEGTNGDPTNPTVQVTVSQTGTPASELTVAATATSNASVAATSGVTVAGNGATRTVSVTPAGGVGYADITLKVTGAEGKSTPITLHYAASAASSTPATTRYYTGAADASTANDVGHGYMLIGDDENNTIRLYKDDVSGAPVKEWNFNSQMGNPEEIDIEASARVGNTIYWTGSMGNSKKGNLKPDRSTLFTTRVSGEGAATELTFGGYYKGLRADLIKWDEAHGNRFGFAAGAASGNVPKQINGFNVEGMEFAPSSTETAYVGFRAPLSPASTGGKALLVPVTNLGALATSGQNTTLHATFGEPILMNLEGLSIREIRKNADGEYLILTGSWAASGPQALWTWDGVPADPPVKTLTELPEATSGGEDSGAWEAIGSMPNLLASGAEVLLVKDAGAVDFYGDGQEAKELIPEWEKSPSNPYTLQLPVTKTAPTNTSAPSISGNPEVGQKLTCSSGEWNGNPEPTFAYEWQRDGTQIGGATAATYAAKAGDAGHQVRCVVTASNSVGSAAANSAAVTIQSAPAEVAAPAISGNPEVGQKLTCSSGEWSGSPQPTFTFAWLRDGTTIPGAEAAVYEATGADVGHQVACEVTATNAVGSASETSAAVTVVAALASPANVAVPTISGPAHVGGALTCSPGEWTANPAPTFAYEWQRDGSEIAGTTADSYTATAGDAGHQIRCVVTATNSVGSTSEPSAAVTVAATTCGGGPITGTGSSLQTEAQRGLWGPGFKAICGASDEVTYEPTSSGAGLGAWGFGGGAFDNTKAFVASDDGPNPAQIANARAKSGSGVLTIPVAQTAIAIVVNSPSNCSIAEITNKQLEGVMQGRIKVWSKVETATGAGCIDAPITRVVRKEGSGTTFQLKNYLLRINEATLPCTPGANQTWRSLEEIGTGAGEAPNTVWPENSTQTGCLGQVSQVVRAEGGGGVVRKINVTNGSIGYAALPDVERNKANGENTEGDTDWLKLQDNGVSTKLSVAKFASPLESSAQAANCFDASYPVPTPAQVGKKEPANADWSQIFGANANAAASSPGAYSLCTLTYVEALTEYSKAGYAQAAEQTVGDYLSNYVLADAGQEALEVGGEFYAPLPSHPSSPVYDILGAARFAASRIGY